jgi:FlaA1/EpsC-like NDP-sugar epimerase
VADSDPQNGGSGLWVFAGRYRTLMSIIAHGFLFTLSLLISFAMAHDFKMVIPWFTHQYLYYLPATIAIKLLVFGAMRMYRDSWRYVGLRDLFAILKASHASFFLFAAGYYCYVWAWPVISGKPLDTSHDIPLSVFLLDWMFTFGLVSSARIGIRFYHEELRPLASGAQIRLLIIGASDVAEMVLREIIRTAEERYHVVGILDDDLAKRHARIRGFDVLGTTDRIREICEQEDVDEVLIAMPDASQRQVRSLIELCQGMNLRFRTVPAVADLLEGRVTVSQIRPVDIEDLLGREAVTLDTGAIEEYVRGRVVMVTGAGGSIGSEMCRQIARFRPEHLLLVERMENALFEIDRELKRSFPDIPRTPLVADIADAARIEQIIERHKPKAIFHAAAHKHVPMMEHNPGEAVKNNIIGTRVLADAAAKANVDKFVMISTDKAVNPTSVMGCSKRVAEMYVQQLQSQIETKTEFVTVRFGNVLGSSGSVVPIFKEQIARGGPVTVTHPEMTRYFMTIPEAAQLVLQAGAMGKGGEIFLLDMGEPVKISDLATDLITLSGLRPHEDIEIVYSGMRPGEKLFEELSITGEDSGRTSHPKIGVMKKRPEDWDRVCDGIAALAAIADDGSAADVRQLLCRTVPEYTPDGVTDGSAEPQTAN